jgi:hypothetical protein
MTRRGSKDGVQVHSENLLSACLPRKAAASLLRRFPETFTVHQDAEDVVILLFERSKLKELSEALKVRRKRRVSASERGRLMRMSVMHSPYLNGNHTHRRESDSRRAR